MLPTLPCSPSTLNSRGVTVSPILAERGRPGARGRLRSRTGRAARACPKVDPYFYPVSLSSAR
jgi:hypothetical protein